MARRPKSLIGGLAVYFLSAKTFDILFLIGAAIAYPTGFIVPVAIPLLLMSSSMVWNIKYHLKTWQFYVRALSVGLMVTAAVGSLPGLVSLIGVAGFAAILLEPVLPLIFTKLSQRNNPFQVRTGGADPSGEAPRQEHRPVTAPDHDSELDNGEGIGPMVEDEPRRTQSFA